MNRKHSPGPWRTFKGHKRCPTSYAVGTVKREHVIFHVYKSMTQEADACLGAAAPELLEACEKLLAYTDNADAFYTSKGIGAEELGVNAPSMSVAGMARAAIAKAKGGGS